MYFKFSICKPSRSGRVRTSSVSAPGSAVYFKGIFCKIVRNFFLAGALLLNLGKADAQNISPVQSQTLCLPPIPSNMESWTQGLENKIEVHLRLLDYKINSADVRLRMILKNESLCIENPSCIHRNIRLYAQQPTILKGDELRDFFSMEQLRFSGISRGEFIKNGCRIPEGVYQLYFEAYEAQSLNKVSTFEIPGIIDIRESDPPIWNLPMANSKIYHQEFYSILFQFTPRHLNEWNNFYQSEYLFEMVEIPPHFEGDWKTQFHLLPKVFQISLQNPSLTYGIENPPLKVGYSYAYRVQAICKNESGQSLPIKNQGYSEIQKLDYVENCPGISFLEIDKIYETGVKLSWIAPMQAVKYKVYLRERKEKAEWFPSSTLFSPSYSNKELQTNTEYECKISVGCNYSWSEDDAIFRFKTTNHQDSIRNLACDQTIPPKVFDDKTPLFLLYRFDQVKTAMGLVVSIDEVRGENGYFSGKGHTYIPFFGQTGIKVKFSKIFVNQNYELIEGKFVAEVSNRNL